MVKAAARTAWKCKENDNKDDCSITVTVGDSARGCVLMMKPGQETIAFPRGAPAARSIDWLLDDQTSDGRMIFKQDGIAFKSDASDAFDWKLRFDSGKGFRWRNLNPNPVLDQRVRKSRAAVGKRGRLRPLPTSIRNSKRACEQDQALATIRPAHLRQRDSEFDLHRRPCCAPTLAPLQRLLAVRPRGCRRGIRLRRDNTAATPG